MSIADFRRACPSIVAVHEKFLEGKRQPGEAEVDECRAGGDYVHKNTGS